MKVKKKMQNNADAGDLIPWRKTPPRFTPNQYAIAVQFPDRKAPDLIYCPLAEVHLTASQHGFENYYVVLRTGVLSYKIISKVSGGVQAVVNLEQKSVAFSLVAK